MPSTATAPAPGRSDRRRAGAGRAGCRRRCRRRRSPRSQSAPRADLARAIDAPRSVVNFSALASEVVDDLLEHIGIEVDRRAVPPRRARSRLRTQRRCLGARRAAAKAHQHQLQRGREIAAAGVQRASCRIRAFDEIEQLRDQLQQVLCVPLASAGAVWPVSGGLDLVEHLPTGPRISVSGVRNSCEMSAKKRDFIRSSSRSFSSSRCSTSRSSSTCARRHSTFETARTTPHTSTM